MDSKMIKKLIYLLLTLVFFIKPSFASVPTPHCPQTPIKASIGEHLPGGWVLWKRTEIYSWWKGFKYRNFKETHQISKWDDTISGYYSISPKQARYYIACCQHKNKEDYFLCAMKEMDMVHYCKAPLLPYDPPIFHCIPWEKLNQEIG